MNIEIKRRLQAIETALQASERTTDTVPDWLKDVEGESEICVRRGNLLVPVWLIGEHGSDELIKRVFQGGKWHEEALSGIDLPPPCRENLQYD